jgi:uncharacterized RDD family membrane protein YckC
VPKLWLETSEGIRIEGELAGVGSRLAAALLDAILIVAGYLVLLLGMLVLRKLVAEAGVGLFEGLTGLMQGVALGGFLLLLPGYFLLFHWIWNGQTPGKRSIRIRVVDAHGAPAAGLPLIVRSLLWPVDALLFVPVPLGLMLVTLTPRCQRLGDLAAGTLVLREAAATSHEEPWPHERWSTREKKALDLGPGMGARLGEEDLRLLRDAICRRDIPPQQRARLYRELVEHYADRLGFTAADSDRLSLKELYLFGRESRGA